MAKIIKNTNYDATCEMTGDNVPYLFDAENGTPVVGCKIFVETSKKNETHPDGKSWIKLPKDNITNRAFFSEDLFNATAVDGEVTVEVKTSAPRVLGASGVRQDIIKYLDDTDSARYTELVTGAVEKYKALKATSKKKKLEDMTKEELEAYIEALKNGTSYTPSTVSAKSFIDVFTDEELDEYNNLLAKAAETKANTPKAKRGPLTDAEKEARKAKRAKNELTKAEKLLALLMADTNAEDEEEVDEGYESLPDEDDDV